MRSPFQNVKAALIADELTAVCLRFDCRTSNVTPLNYKLLLKFWKPDLLFIESAWHGPRNAWKVRLAAYPERPERNNLALRRVVAYARDLGVPCVFWNKEDGVHFDRFIGSTALFDTIFTVDEECVPRYRASMGADVKVQPLMFAVQPMIHSPAARNIMSCHTRRANWV